MQRSYVKREKIFKKSNSLPEEAIQNALDFIWSGYTRMHAAKHQRISFITSTPNSIIISAQRVSEQRQAVDAVKNKWIKNDNQTKKCHARP